MRLKNIITSSLSVCMLSSAAYSFPNIESVRHQSGVTETGEKYIKTANKIELRRTLEDGQVFYAGYCKLTGYSVRVYMEDRDLKAYIYSKNGDSEWSTFSSMADYGDGYFGALLSFGETGRLVVMEFNGRNSAYWQLWT